MSAIWEACRGQVEPRPIGGTLIRLVESQEQIATSKLVDSLSEQAALEEMLEGNKPPLRDGPRHYLLSTPFRYPPLRHGSRFGSRFEPSLFYGSLARGSLLAEGAYYRFLFWYGMAAPPGDALVTQHSSFRARYRCVSGLRLQEPPFLAYRTVLTNPCDYAATQSLGNALRGAGIEAFEFVSARDPGGGLNVALIAPRALVSSKPLSLERWLCRTGADNVQFLNETDNRVYTFELDTFLVGGRLPLAAA